MDDAAPTSSSDDRTPGLITPDMIPDLTRLVPVDDLDSWLDPFEWDMELAARFATTFGELTMPVVQNGKVIWGQEIVETERLERNFDGRLAVLDITDLGWTDLRAKAASIGLNRAAQMASPNIDVLADVLAEMASADEELLAASGYTSDDLADLMEEASANALDEDDDEDSGDDEAPRRSKDDTGTAGIGLTPKDRIDAYEASSVRSLVLSFDLAQYSWVTSQLADLRRKRGLDSNTDMLLLLVAEATGSNAPNLALPEEA